MADKIREFFSKKKGGKFKGKGQKLTDSAKNVVAQQEEKTAERRDPTADAKQAGLAALARLERKGPGGFVAGLPRAGHMWKPRTEPNVVATFSSSNEDTKVNSNPEILAVGGVFFKCPIISPEVLPKEEWRERIRTFLYEQLELEKALTSCLMIHSFNKSREEVSQCVETLCIYLSNILTHPGEEKYKRIRLSNRAFTERIAKIEGAEQFLEAAGFVKQRLPFNDGEEDFFVFLTDPVDEDYLEMLMDSIKSAEPIPLELHRNAQLMSPEVASKRHDLPDEFYRLSVDELKREVQAQTERIESTLQLRTKAMREKDELREVKKYRYTLLRFRFPDGLLLQGTFNVYEKVSVVEGFVRQHLRRPESPFRLRNALGEELFLHTGDEGGGPTLLEARMVPAVLLTFESLEEKLSPTDHFLNDEILVLLQSL